MSEFDVLFGLVLRLEDSDGTNIWRKCDIKLPLPKEVVDFLRNPLV